MHLKDLKIGKEYAIKESVTDLLVRLRVTKIVSTKTDNHSHGVKSVVYGYAKGVEVGPITTDDILGSYEEYTSLVEEKKRQEAERKLQEAALKAKRHKAAKLLAEFAGLKYDEAGNDYHGVRALFSSVEIFDDALPALIAKLEAELAKAA